MVASLATIQITPSFPGDLANEEPAIRSEENRFLVPDDSLRYAEVFSRVSLPGPITHPPIPVAGHPIPPRLSLDAVPNKWRSDWFSGGFRPGLVFRHHALASQTPGFLLSDPAWSDMPLLADSVDRFSGISLLSWAMIWLAI